MSKDKNWVRVSALRAACASGIPYGSSIHNTVAQDDAAHLERILDRAADFEKWLTRTDKDDEPEEEFIDEEESVDREPFFEPIQGVDGTVYVKCTHCAWRLRTANLLSGELSGFAQTMYNGHTCARWPKDRAVR